MNVDDYLKRIKYTGSQEPTLETLRALCIAHVTNLPYSNYGFFGGPRCVMDYDYMYNTMVTRGQGDICYVCNALFGWLLRQLGFEIREGHGRFWFNNQFSVPYHHLIPVAVIDGEEWLYDVGWLLYEPLKMELMKPQIQQHGIFRIRKADEENWFQLDTFNKSTIDKDGKVIEQGPDLPGGYNGSLDCEEMKSFDLKLWSPMFKFMTHDHPITAFCHMTDYFQDDENSPFRQMLISHMFLENKKMFRVFMGEFVLKEFIDPLTEKIIYAKKITNDQEATELTEQYTNTKLDFPLKFYSKTI